MILVTSSTGVATGVTQSTTKKRKDWFVRLMAHRYKAHFFSEYSQTVVEESGCGELESRVTGKSNRFSHLNTVIKHGKVCFYGIFGV